MTAEPEVKLLPWQIALAAREGQRGEADVTIRRCGVCTIEIKRRPCGNWQWSRGMCPRCEMRDRRARAKRAARPRLVSGWYGYSPRLGTARGVAA